MHTASSLSLLHPLLLAHQRHRHALTLRQPLWAIAQNQKKNDTPRAKESKMMLKCLCVYLFVCVWNWTIWNILNNNPIQNESLSIILNWNEFIRWKDSELPMDAQESNRIAPDRLAIDFLLGIVAHWRLKILLYAHALQFHQYYYLSHFDIASTDFLRIDCIVGCQTIGTKFTFSNVVSHSKLLHRSHFLIFVNFVLFSTSLLALFSYCFFFSFSLFQFVRRCECVS